MSNERTKDFYPELNPPRDEDYIQIIAEQRSYGRIILGIFFGVILGVSGGLLAYNYSFTTTPVNETTLNESFNIGNAIGYQNAIYDVSLMVLENNTLHVFTNATGEVTLQYLDLIKYYTELNQKEVNQNG